MTAHRAEAVIGEGGSLLVQGIPLPQGEHVDVIVLTRAPRTAGVSPDAVRERLRGSVLKDERPFDPVVPPEEWDAVR